MHAGRSSLGIVRSVFLIVVGVAALASVVRADEPRSRSRLSGAVRDATHGGPVESALVLIAGPRGLEQSLTTDRDGRYSAVLAPGTYHVVFVYGPSRTSGRVIVPPGRGAVLDGSVDSVAGEVIIIRDRIAPPVPPKPKNFEPRKAPPYSDRAVLSDAWTKAWLLLDVDETGRVTRLKFLKRPGHDLEKIARSEAFKLRFDPARDRDGKAMRSWVVWPIEWPSAWWLSMFVGTRSAMPKIVGFPPRRQDDYVPCAGSGPMNLGSLHPTYKDCSRPDLSKAPNEPWIMP